MYLLFGIFLDFIWFLWFIPSLASFTIHIIGSKLNLFAPIYKLVNWFTYGLINSDFCNVFTAFFNIYECPFRSPIATLPAKNRFSRRLVLMPKGVNMRMRQMNIYYTEPPFAPYFGLFAAKCSAIWYKTQCILVLNAMRFAAKRNAFWC